MRDFELVRPATVADAAAALGGEGAQALGGGQTLIPTMKQRLAAPARLVSTAGIAEMAGVEFRDGAVAVGGAATHATVAAEAAARFPALAALAGGIGDPAVRNRGTIGGSLANNDPAACYPAAVLGAGATVTTDRRDIAADDFFRGMFETALDEGELIVSVSFPVPEKAAYAKFPQPASRFALAGVFAAACADGPRVAVTGASGSGAFRWTEAEAALSSGFSPEAVADLSLPEDGLLSDLHGTPAYRANLVRVLAKRAVAAAS